MHSTKGILGKKKKSLVKLTLIFLVTFSPFTTPSPKFFVLSILHNFIVSLSKQYKSFHIWSFFQVSILFWYLCKILVKYVCSPFNLAFSDYFSDQAKDSKSWGKSFYPLQLQGPFTKFSTELNWALLQPHEDTSPWKHQGQTGCQWGRHISPMVLTLAP